ncbi:long-chain fatty acid--CoA ligase [Caballeronia novacaledonica]|uniref:Long-chain fatty acid--CoA ligase n=1 Tax=Caballeronia novacaledonica TaxID=1544861 RepID=A0A2U3I368_9BURK|nr:acyl-CoA synthetase [Caballeronia novacaledonica]SPB14584.1 long-chain fatty acid--CoA ligase [Caballeronia novacaledonica]
MEQWSWLGAHARRTPEKLAVIHGETGISLTYRVLDARSLAFARLLAGLGLRAGDHIAVVMENNLRYFEVCWAAVRSGLVVTPVNRYLTAAEAAYIVKDGGSKVVISSHAMRKLASGLVALTPDCVAHFMIDGVIDGWQSYEQALSSAPEEIEPEERLGTLMLYSSGTTGRPKGILRAPTSTALHDLVDPVRQRLYESYRFDSDTVYLSTAPLYHSAPIAYALHLMCRGATLVFMERFDAQTALALIERYRITHSQWVPTMFVRLLKLPGMVREGYDLSSLRVAIHAAAPCPIEVKQQMIAWWGPILHEYYGATEGNGITQIDSADWLAHPGSVGRPLCGTLHICDDTGAPCPDGTPGLIYFERAAPAFHYHRDEEKTRRAQHPLHPLWTAVGDIGYVDGEGYLYLTDRQSFMIISGGVNIYPQAIEDALVSHPHVLDAAVIGVPHPEMGEEVMAVVELVAEAVPCDTLADELRAFLRERVARYMVPRSFDFVDALPRLPTGKLYKQALRERYGAVKRAPGA